MRDVLAVEVHEAKAGTHLNPVLEVERDAEVVGGHLDLIGKIVFAAFLVWTVHQVSEIDVETRELALLFPERHMRPAVDIAISRAQRDQRVGRKRVLVVRVKWARAAELLQPIPEIGASWLWKCQQRRQKQPDDRQAAPHRPPRLSTFTATLKIPAPAHR